MANNDETVETKSDEQKAADKEFKETRPVHPVIRAAERKLQEVEGGRYMDVQRHEELRLEEQGIEPEEASRLAAQGRGRQEGMTSG